MKIKEIKKLYYSIGDVSQVTGLKQYVLRYWETEFNILLNATKEDLIKVTDEKIADAIITVREGKVKIKPGYDGVYGQPTFENTLMKSDTIFVGNEKQEIKENKQKGLSSFF